MKLLRIGREILDENANHLLIGNAVLRKTDGAFGFVATDCERETIDEAADVRDATNTT